MTSNLISILLVDDDDVDAAIICRNLAKLQIANPVFRAHDGLEALEILHSEKHIESMHYPYLLLLDMNMPRMTGGELLQALSQDDKLGENSVFILSTLPHVRALVQPFQKHIAGYLEKGQFDNSLAERLHSLQTNHNPPT